MMTGTTTKRKHKKHKNKDKEKEKYKKPRSASSCHLAINNNDLNQQNKWSLQMSDVANFHQTEPGNSKHHSHHHYHHHHHHGGVTQQNNHNLNTPEIIISTQITENDPSVRGSPIVSIYQHAPLEPMKDQQSPHMDKDVVEAQMKKLESSPVPNQPLKIVLKVQTRGLISNNSINNQDNCSTVDYSSSDDPSAESATESSTGAKESTSIDEKTRLQDPASTDASGHHHHQQQQKQPQQQKQQFLTIELASEPSTSICKQLIVPSLIKKVKKSKKSKHKKHSHHHHHHHHHSCKKHHSTSLSSVDKTSGNHSILSPSLANIEQDQFQKTPLNSCPVSEPIVQSSNTEIAPQSPPAVQIFSADEVDSVKPQVQINNTQTQPEKSPNKALLVEEFTISNQNEVPSTTVQNETVSERETSMENSADYEDESSASNETSSHFKSKLSKPLNNLDNYKIPKLSAMIELQQELNLSSSSSSSMAPLTVSIPDDDEIESESRESEISDTPAQDSSNESCSATPTKTVINSEKNAKKDLKKLKSPKKPQTSSEFKQLLQYLLRLLQRKDQHYFFAVPVSDIIAPNYSQIISHPMDLSTIERKIHTDYLTLGDFKSDVKLMVDNCMIYNKPDTIYYKAASKMWHYFKQKLIKKEALSTYSKNYPNILPSELSLMPSNQPTPSSAPSSTNGIHDVGENDSSDCGLLKINIDHPLSCSNLSLSPNFLYNKLGSPIKSITLKESRFLSSPNFLTKNQDVGHFSSDRFFLSADPNKKIGYANQSPMNRKPGEELFDGLTASELLDSVKQAMDEAQKRLWKTGRQYHLSYLEPVLKTIQEDDSNDLENGDHNDEEVLLRSIDCQPPSLDHPYPVKRFSLKEICPPSIDGRVSVNVLTPDVPFNQNITVTTAIGITSDGGQKPGTKTNASKSDEKMISETSINDAQESKEEISDEKPEEKDEVTKSDIYRKENLIGELFKELVPHYGNEEFGLNYALSIARFAKSSEYTCNLVASLLSVLTENDHRKMTTKFQKLLQEKFDDTSPPSTSSEKT